MNLRLMACALAAGCLSTEPKGGEDTGVNQPPTVTTTDGMITLEHHFLLGSVESGGSITWEVITLTVPYEYWADYARYQGEPAEGVCSPVPWTAVHDGQCVLMSDTCPNDPRDPDFLDCTGLDGCCERAEPGGGWW